MDFVARILSLGFCRMDFVARISSHGFCRSDFVARILLLLLSLVALSTRVGLSRVGGTLGLDSTQRLGFANGKSLHLH
jgi:hypothetical protein